MMERTDVIDSEELTAVTPEVIYLDRVDTGFEGFGEGLVMDERLVVSPCEGSLRDRHAREGEYVCAGDVVARVVGPDGQSVPVLSPFAGWVMGFLVPHGSPVRRREPVLWLRSH